MIIPPTESFFIINLQGEAADSVVNKFSPSSAVDIEEVVLTSEDYPEDIEAQNELDDALDKIHTSLDCPVTVKVEHNPLYIPASQEQIDSVLDGDPNNENFKFVGLDGNPFTLKSITFKSRYEDVVSASVRCHQFDLPSYNEIIDAQESARLN